MPDHFEFVEACFYVKTLLSDKNLRCLPSLSSMEGFVLKLLCDRKSQWSLLNSFSLLILVFSLKFFQVFPVCLPFRGHQMCKGRLYNNLGLPPLWISSLWDFFPWYSPILITRIISFDTSSKKTKQYKMKEKWKNE